MSETDHADHGAAEAIAARIERRWAVLAVAIVAVLIGMATFIGLHLFLIAKLGIAEPPYSKRRLAIERAEDEARRAAERERLPYGRRPVPPVAPRPSRPEPVKAEERS